MITKWGKAYAKILKNMDSPHFYSENKRELKCYVLFLLLLDYYKRKNQSMKAKQQCRLTMIKTSDNCSKILSVCLLIVKVVIFTCPMLHMAHNQITTIRGDSIVPAIAGYMLLFELNKNQDIPTLWQDAWNLDHFCRLQMICKINDKICNHSARQLLNNQENKKLN